MVADPQSGVQSGVIREDCLHFHVLIRHGKGHLGGVVLVRGQEVVRLLNTIHLHRPVDKVLVGFRLPARCCYSIALSSFGLIHSAVYRCDVIRNIAIIRFRLNIIGGHGQGRSGFGAILQQIGKFCFVRDLTLSITYNFIQLPACKCLSFGSISGSQNHFSACGHRSLQFFNFALKLCSGIVCGHSVQRTHITACIAVLVFCIVVKGVLGLIFHAFLRLRAIVVGALMPVVGLVMEPVAVVVGVVGHVQLTFGLYDITTVDVRAAIVGIGDLCCIFVNGQDVVLLIQSAAVQIHDLGCIEFARQLA